MTTNRIVEANDFGWNCKKHRVTGQWECVTPEQGMVPKVPEKVYSDKNVWWWFNDSFDPYQEQAFKALHASFAKDPWGMCASQAVIQPMFHADKALRNVTPADVYADGTEVFDEDAVRFYGDINFQRADQFIQADQADYNKASQELGLYGDIIYKDGGFAFYGDSARVNLADNKSIVRNALFLLPSSPGRGRAEVLYRENSFLSRLKDVAYTRCEPGNQDWMLHASKMKINDETGRASIKHGWLEFKNLPIMYFPYGSFPIDDRRLSGLLSPKFGFSGRNGVDISLPFYWNIAPNFDAILTPRYMGERGFMIGTDFRYLWKNSNGQINVEVMPEDKKTKKLRWGGSYQHTTYFSRQMKLSWDANFVSDNAYFSDLSGTLGVTNRQRYLRSSASYDIALPWMSFSARIDNYQNIDPAQSDSSVPYRRLPQIKLGMHKTVTGLPIGVPIDLDLDSEYVMFQRHFPDGQPEGQRLNLKPSISLPFIDQGGFIIPKFALQHTQYWLSGQNNVVSHSLSKTLPIVSLDSGLFFERDFASLTHTIEPRLFYLYVPYVDQSNIPNFDTSLYDFNSSSLFRDNVFNGVDKTQNTNQITTALTTRLVKNGHDRLKLTVGEIFYFEDRKVNLSGNQVHNELLSNLVAEVSSEITDEIKFTSKMQWSHKNNAIDRGNADLRYHGAENGYIFNIGYRYRMQRDGQDAQNQIMASTIIPIYDGWSVIGLYRYSFVEGINLEHFYGIEKDSCCWRLRLIMRRYIRTVTPNAEGVIDIANTIFFQFELKGFTSLGDKLDNFLLKNISGYRKPNY
jgi:LPS-assembly protein